jgi:hypothetical protein
VAHSRIDDLRRRVEADPASIAFAQLAEEYRRAGQTEEAVRVCREGLTRHPGYLSARVTLGRALLDLGQLGEARTELRFVANEAPENLAAVRGLAEIFHREGDAASALDYFRRALTLAPHDPELEEIVQQLSRQVGAESGPSNGLTFEEAHQELLSAADRVPLAPTAASADPAPATSDDAGGSMAPFNFDTLVAALGTPAAPPLVEAVVAGETPAVFELPDMPALGSDPFAALESELRAQGDTAGPSVADQVAALASDEPADPAPAPTEEPPAEPLAAATDGDVESALIVTQAEVAASVDAELVVAEVPSAWSAAAHDAAALEEESSHDPDLERDEEAPWAPASPPSFEPLGPITPVAADETPEATAAVETAEPSAAAVEPEGPPSMEATMAAEETVDEAAGPTPATEAPEPDPPAPAKATGDDVLGDLEDWLNTLQDRSNQ